MKIYQITVERFEVDAAGELVPAGHVSHTVREDDEGKHSVHINHPQCFQGGFLETVEGVMDCDAALVALGKHTDDGSGSVEGQLVEDPMGITLVGSYK